MKCCEKCWCGWARLRLFRSLSFSSVAGGGSSPPYWPVKYAKSHVFGALKADFWWKNENSPHKGNWVPKLWSRYRDSAWKSVWISNFGRKIRLNFSEDLFFWDHLFLGWKSVWIFDFGRKIRLNFGEDLFSLFFGDHLVLGWKSVWLFWFSEKFRLNFRINRVILIQEQWKFGSRSFAVFSLFQKSAPLFQTLATALLKRLRTDTILLWLGYQRPVRSAPIFKISLSLEWHKHEYRLVPFNNYFASTLLTLQPIFFKQCTNRQCQRKAEEWGLQPSETKQRKYERIRAVSDHLVLCHWPASATKSKEKRM